MLFVRGSGRNGALPLLALEAAGSAGIGDELRAAMMAEGGCWGSLVLYRERASAPFRPEKADALHAAAGADRPLQASGGGAGLVGEVDATPGPELLVLGPDLTLLATSPPARRWLAAGWHGAGLPSLVYALCARLRAVDGMPDTLPLRIRARTATGDWVVVQAVRLDGSNLPGAIAIVVEPASPATVIPLLMAAYSLSRREREVVRLVLAGRSGREIAAALHISPLAVQDHLKAVFPKAGVGSRRQLLAALLNIG